MKKTIMFACLLAAMIPSPGIADEPIVASHGEFSVVDINRTQPDPDFPAEKAQDEELLEVVGHGVGSFLPWLAEVPQKPETVGSRIKLWDEANRWGGRIFQLRGESIQKTTVSVFVNK